MEILTIEKVIVPPVSTSLSAPKAPSSSHKHFNIEFQGSLFNIFNESIPLYDYDYDGLPIVVLSEGASYKIINLASDILGSGSQFVVFAAVQIETGLPVAIKIDRTPMSLSPDSNPFKYLRLAIGLRGLYLSGCPNIAELLEFTLLPDSEFFPGLRSVVVERVIEGLNGFDWFKNHHDLDEMQKVFRDIAATLDFLHNLPNPVIHRDVKPNNFIVKSDGSVHGFLVDFGISTLTPLILNQLVGTPNYMSPNQSLSKPPLPSDDLWSLGVTVYVALTNSEEKSPFCLSGDYTPEDILDTVCEQKNMRAIRADDLALPFKGKAEALTAAFREFFLGCSEKEGLPLYLSMKSAKEVVDYFFAILEEE